MDHFETITEAPTRAATPGGKREERVLQILREARQLFAEVGYAGFSVRSLARRLGMSQGNLQYYFARKEQLFEEMVRFIVERYDPARIISDHGDQTPENRLKTFVEFLVEDLKDPMTNTIFFELWSIGQRDDFVKATVDQFYRRYVQNFDSMIAAINPALDASRRGNRAALAATQIEGLMVLLAAGRPQHACLVGVEAACVEQILHLAKRP